MPWEVARNCSVICVRNARWQSEADQCRTAQAQVCRSATVGITGLPLDTEAVPQTPVDSGCRSRPGIWCRVVLRRDHGWGTLFLVAMAVGETELVAMAIAVMEVIGVTIMVWHPGPGIPPLVIGSS